VRLVELSLINNERLFSESSFSSSNTQKYSTKNYIIAQLNNKKTFSLK
jgi:hypothetical protein